MEQNFLATGQEPYTWNSDNRSYTAAVPALITGLDFSTLVASDVLQRCLAAEKLITSFDARLNSLIGSLELHGIEAMLLQTEAVSSSQIEHITAGASQIRATMIGESKNQRPTHRQQCGDHEKCSCPS